MAGEPCPGSCNRHFREAVEAYRQALAAYDPLDKDTSRPERPDVRPWPGEPVWCSPCTSRISQRLGQLDYAISILQAYADGHRDAPDAPLVGGSAEAMSPSEAADTAEDLGQMLVGWEAAYRKHRGWPAPFHPEDLASWTTECHAWLAQHLRGILASPLAVDFGTEILSWHREIVSSAKAGTRRLRKPMRCPGCRQLTLTWTEGEEMVNCADPGCRVAMRYDEYEAEIARRVGNVA